jgi:hypothetical protein
LRYNGGVREFAYAVSAAAAAALAGCGGGGAHPTWTGPPPPAGNGSVAVDGFDDYASKVDAEWERSAAMAAAEFLRLDRTSAARTTIAGKASAEGTGPETVTVTLDGLPDDSVRAERWTLVFARGGDVYRLARAARLQRCQPRRGHQDFSPAACV